MIELIGGRKVDPSKLVFHNINTALEPTFIPQLIQLIADYYCSYKESVFEVGNEVAPSDRRSYLVKDDKCRELTIQSGAAFLQLVCNGRDLYGVPQIRVEIPRKRTIISNTYRIADQVIYKDGRVELDTEELGLVAISSGFIVNQDIYVSGLGKNGKGMALLATDKIYDIQVTDHVVCRDVRMIEYQGLFAVSMVLDDSSTTLVMTRFYVVDSCIHYATLLTPILLDRINELYLDMDTQSFIILAVGTYNGRESSKVHHVAFS